MDIGKLSDAVEQKHGVRLNQYDPVFMVGTIAEAVGKETLAAVAKIMTDTADQMATAAVLAENTSRTKSERIFTEGAKYGSDKIKAAGDDAARRVVSEVQSVLEQLTEVRAEARAMMRVSWAAAGVSVLATMALISWQVWGPR